LLARLHDPGQVASIGLPAEMEAPDSADRYLSAGLAQLGIEADEVEMAVIKGSHALFWPAILALMEMDVDADPERELDLSRPPAPQR
jgi:hypothetical protein